MQPRKHAALIKAWADGAEIQVKETPHHNWLDVRHPHWAEYMEYRVKPERPQVVDLFAQGNTGGSSAQWTISGMTPNHANVRFSFDPDSGELLSVEKI